MLKKNRVFVGLVLGVSLCLVSFPGSGFAQLGPTSPPAYPQQQYPPQPPTYPPQQQFPGQQPEGNAIVWIQTPQMASAAAPQYDASPQSGPSLASPPAFGGAKQGPLPAGWLMRETADGTAVQIYEQNQPGAIGELFLIQPGRLGASAVLHQGFYTPRAQTLRVQNVARTADDRLAYLFYQQTSQARLIGSLRDLNRWLENESEPQPEQSASNDPGGLAQSPVRLIGYCPSLRPRAPKNAFSVWLRSELRIASCSQQPGIS